MARDKYPEFHNAEPLSNAQSDCVAGGLA